MESEFAKFNAPIGNEFLVAAWNQEDRCESDTDAWLPNAGVKAPKCLTAIGSVLSLLDRLASCWWGCGHGNRAKERIIGRAVSNSRAALRLVRLGFYDEALSITRSIGENANLLALFTRSSNHLDRWMSGDSGIRRREYSPVKVRLELDKTGSPIPMDEQSYNRLCELSVHLTPTTTPQSYNPLGVPVLGGYFQEAGVIVVLNELALMIAWTAALGVNFIDPAAEVWVDSVSALEKSIGSVDVQSVGGYCVESKQNPEIQELGELLRKHQEVLSGSLKPDSDFRS